MFVIPSEFTKTSKGYFGVNYTHPKNWADAEAACKRFGANVHLATLDTQEVSTHMFYQISVNDRIILVAP